MADVMLRDITIVEEDAGREPAEAVEKFTYKHVYVPVDNSDYSNMAVELGVALGKVFGSTLYGNHVYAAKMHDIRFKQMEFTLPEEYRDEGELEKQRKIHDSLITMGLQLISDSYLDVMQRKCAEAGLPFEPRALDGKNWVKIAEELETGRFDLLVIGALGIGAVKESTIGSVCERVVRRAKIDALVVKDVRPLEEQTGAILVAIDGSPQSFAGLMTGIRLAKTFGRPLEAVAVYDPYLHYSMFNGIVGVLSEKAAKVFKFKEQEALHEEVIDTGLAKIYQSHLEIARRIADEQGIFLKITLLDGKAFQKVIQYARRDPGTARSGVAGGARPWMLIAGKIGVHSDDAMDIGSNAENFLRLAPCHVLLVTRKFHPPLDLKAEESISWTEEAEARMGKVPQMVRGIARTAILRFAVERGHSIVSSSVIDAALGEILPEPARKAMGIAAKTVAEEAYRGELVSYICSICGHTVRNAEPVVCTVCDAGPEQFRKIDRAVLGEIARGEGDLEEEIAFDGRKLKWSSEARGLLMTVPSGYERRRAKARIEKSARVRGIEVIPAEVARAIIDEENADQALTRGKPPGSGHDPSGARGRAELGGGDGEAADLLWTDEAVERLNQVPQGFMRNMTRDRIEALARRSGVSAITLEIVEGGIGEAKEIMNEAMADYLKGKGDGS